MTISLGLAYSTWSDYSSFTTINIPVTVRLEPLNDSDVIRVQGK